MGLVVRSTAEGGALACDPATVGDVIRFLQEFPPEMVIFWDIECVVDPEDEILLLRDSNTSHLLSVIKQCPQCSHAVTEREATRPASMPKSTDHKH